MTKQMTEFELTTEVQKFYKNYFSIDKALALYKLEYGYDVEIVEPEEETFVNTTVFAKYNLPESVTVKSMEYMYNLQQSGIVNMMMCSNEIQTGLMVDRQTAREIHSAYINHYTELYNPEELL